MGFGSTDGIALDDADVTEVPLAGLSFSRTIGLIAVAEESSSVKSTKTGDMTESFFGIQGIRAMKHGQRCEYVL